MASLRTSMSLARGAFKPARSLPKLAAPRSVVTVRASTQKDQSQTSPVNVVTPAVLSMMTSLMSAAPALAEGEAAAAVAPNGLDLFILAAPISIYGIFYVFREKVNPKAGVSDLALIAVAFIILANIFSIVVFKVRYF